MHAHDQFRAMKAIGMLRGLLPGFPRQSQRGDPMSRSHAAGFLRHVPAVAAFFAIYMCLEWLTRVHELGALGITLWNPVKALSFGLLLLKGYAYAPVIFIAALLADLVVYGAAKSVPASVATSIVVTAGYAGLAAVLVNGLGFSLRRPDVRSVVSLLVLVPAATFLIACAYCGVLVLFGDLPAGQYWEAVQHLWVGDTVGIIIVLPVGMVLLSSRRARTDHRPVVTLLDALVFVVGVLVALRLIFFFDRDNEFHFFYLLFLPVVWLAMRAGFAGAAIGACIVHVLLVGIINWGGYPSTTFMGLQLLVLALASTGLLLGITVDERRRSDQLLREQHTEVARMARHAAAGAMGLTLAHQISQPLSTVATYLHVGRHLLATAPANTEPVTEALEKASAQLRLAKEILERLRDFVSRGTVQMAPTDVVALTRKVVALAEDDARTHGVAIRLDAGAVPPVLADQLQLEQALINLINNAIDAAAETTDRSGLVTIEVSTAGAQVRIAIEDNGPGVAGDVVEDLFEPFVTTKADGMGLGLVLSRELISAQGGTVSWEEAGSSGARFIITLPVQPERMS